MIERFLILAAFIIVAIVALQVWRWWLHRRLALAQARELPQPLRDQRLPAKPVVLYFTTPTCTQCRYQQTPILQELGAGWQDRVDVRKLDAHEHDELAQHFGVMTSPTTIVLDCEQRVTAINHGLASKEKLAGQLAALIDRHDAALCSHHLAPQPA
ncbi:MAG: thioredoxin family protein [Caldilineales bacterium]|nr:thioredoxin family protein [Caldilineales bacterium]